MKVALVHDQLQEFGGAERVLIALKQIFPKAKVFTAFTNQKSLKRNVPDYKTWKIKTSWAAHIPFFGKLYSPLRFLAPKIWESFDFTGYDLVVSSSGWYMSKGIITHPPTIHVSYLHHPPRYLYGYETAVEWQRYRIVKIYASIVNHYLRIWDFESSQRPDYIIANSKETQKRVTKFYRRDATVIYPPVGIPKNIESYNLPKKPYYITVSRLSHAKHIEILIEAANKSSFTLKIIGSGKDDEKLKTMAGPTVEFLGNIPDDQMKKIFKHAKAFLFASVDEEFGIAPIEAMGFGIPVIAYRSGGLTETVINGKNGFLYDELTVDSLLEAMTKLVSGSWKDYLKIRKAAYASAEKYSFDNFKKNILAFLEKVTK